MPLVGISANHCLKKIHTTKLTLKGLFPNPLLFLRFFAAVLTTLLIFPVAIKLVSKEPIKESFYMAEAESPIAGVSTSKVTIDSMNASYILETPQKEDIDKANEKYDEKIKRIQREAELLAEQQARERQNKVVALANYLRGQKSPMADYSTQILDACMPYGVNFCKMYLSIAGVESGFGVVPIGCCNAYGLIGVKYADWNQSITESTKYIATGYYLKGINTFEKLAYSSYGPQNPENWIKDLYYFASQLNFL